MCIVRKVPLNLDWHRFTCSDKERLQSVVTELPHVDISELAQPKAMGQFVVFFLALIGNPSLRPSIWSHINSLFNVSRKCKRVSRALNSTSAFPDTRIVFLALVVDLEELV